MKALDRKLLGDLRRMKAQAAAIGLLLACAVATLTGTMGTHRALAKSRDAYYDSNRFGDLFAQLARAPRTVLDRLAELPGVIEVDGRISELVTLEVPGLDEPASATLLSLPLEHEQGLSRVSLQRGRWPAPGAFEALASRAFMDASTLALGDSVFVVVNGLRRRLRVVGVAISPDTIYPAKPGELIPDDRHYGVFWVGEALLAADLDMQRAFNDVTARVAAGTRFDSVLTSIDRELAAYGGLSAYGRHDHPSHRFLSDDLEQLRLIGTVLPAVFFAVAAYLLNMVLSRLIAVQREQIATLKALGYSNRAIAWHYLELATVVVAAAVLAGAVAGLGLTRVLASFYVEQLYRLPALVIEPDPGLLALAALLALAVAYAGVAGAVLRALALPPAEAMRPPAPQTFRPTLIERLAPRGLLAQRGRMVLRSLARRPARTLLSTAGIAAAVAILVAGLSLVDAMRTLVDLQFRRAERHDVTVTFSSTRAAPAVQELRAMPEVLGCEPFRTAPVVLTAGTRSRRTTLVGMEPGAGLRRALDGDGRPHPPPPSGLLVSAKLAELLAVRPGDPVQVEVLEGRRFVLTAEVNAIVEDLLGTTAYMERASMNRLLREGDRVSGAHLATGGATPRALVERLRSMPVVAGVSEQASVLASFERFTGAAIFIFGGVMLLFAALIASGVVYNAARVLVAERERELATLRVIGFSRAEISFVLLAELGVQVALAVPLGLVAGHALSAAMSGAVESDLLRFPVVARAASYAWAALVIIVASLVVALGARRRLDRLDLVAVLKSRE